MPDRITLSRAKGWRKPAGAVVVARPSIWGNPWGIGTPGTLDDRGDRRLIMLAIDQQAAVTLFRQWLRDGYVDPLFLPSKLQWPKSMARAMHDALHGRRHLILANLDQLRGRDLCCWCKPGTPCHADVLMEIANG